MLLRPVSPFRSQIGWSLEFVQCQFKKKVSEFRWSNKRSTNSEWSNIRNSDSRTEYSVLRIRPYNILSSLLPLTDFTYLPEAKPGDPRSCHDYAVDRQSQAHSFPLKYLYITPHFLPSYLPPRGKKSSPWNPSASPHPGPAFLLS